MDLNEGTWWGIKHIWELLAAALSSILGFIFYKYKKHNEEFTTLKKDVQSHTTRLDVHDERFTHLKIDIKEIKEIVNKIYYKL